MYTQLLEAVLAYEADTPSLLRSQGPLADVVRLRHALERHLGRTDPGWALQAVADQLAYDAALVRLARQRGVDVGIQDFDVPDRGRAVIESALLALGVHLPHRTAPEVDARVTTEVSVRDDPGGAPAHGHDAG
jgi:hypothetical protein